MSWVAWEAWELLGLGVAIGDIDHFLSDEFSARVFGGFAFGIVPGGTFVAAVGGFELAAAAVRLAGPKECVGSEGAARVVFHEEIELGACFGELIGFEPALGGAEEHAFSPVMLGETFDELFGDFCGGGELLPRVEVFGDTDDDVGDEGAVWPGVGERDVLGAGGFHVVPFFVALSEFVLGVGGEGAFGVVLNDAFVMGDGIVVVLQFLRELAEEVVGSGLVEFAGIIAAQFFEDLHPVVEGLVGEVFLFDGAVVFEEFEERFCHAELGFDGDFF